MIIRQHKRKTKKATTARTEKKNTNSGFMGKLGIPLGVVTWQNVIEQINQ